MGSIEFHSAGILFINLILILRLRETQLAYRLDKIKERGTIILKTALRKD
jgi:hypothetical protein